MNPHSLSSRLIVLLSSEELSRVRAAAGDVPLSRYARRAILESVAYQEGTDKALTERNEAARETQAKEDAAS